MSTWHKPMIWGLVGVLSFVGSSHAVPLGTGFTYQGQLKQNGSPMNGAVHLRFSLWDAAGAGTPPVGGAQIGSSQLLANTPVSSGLFTVALNSAAQFGSNVFKGDARWIQVEVCADAGCATATVLSPRQPVTAAPYALGPWNIVPGGIAYNALRVGIGTDTPVSPLDIAATGDGTELLRFSTERPWVFRQTSSGSTAGLELFSTVGLKTFQITSNTGVKVATFMADDVNSRVGIGTTTPTARLDVVASSQTGVSSTATSGAAVVGVSTSNFGVVGNSTSFPGVSGYSATSNAVQGTGGTGIGVYGESYGSGSAGVFGKSPYIGVQGSTVGSAAERFAVYGNNAGSATGYAGYFNGHVRVTGLLFKPAGSFQIDHPLDPANKYLSHSFVESPDMMNIYNGNIVTDAQGDATVTLPDWFEALNKDFRYQLTVIGQFAQAIVAQEIQNRAFRIKTDKPNVKVSWQVTGIRKDAYAEAHRIVVEEDKPVDKRGKFDHPELFGRPATEGTNYRAEQALN